MDEADNNNLTLQIRSGQVAAWKKENPCTRLLYLDVSLMGSKVRQANLARHTT